MKIALQICLVALLLVPGTAVNAEVPKAEIQALDVKQEGRGLKVELKLTTSVTPKVEVATNPDRLVLDLPNTVANAKQKHILVNRAGVRTLRVGLTSVVPLVTRVVLDLAHAQPYGLSVKGNTVALTVLPDAAQESKKPESEPLVVASNSGLPGITDVGLPAMTRAATKRMGRTFKVKFVTPDTVYLEGGRNAGLEPGMKLSIRETNKGTSHVPANVEGAVVAELVVVGVAQTSAVTEVREVKRTLKAGDWAYLSAEDTDVASAKKNLPVLQRRTDPIVPGAAPPSNSLVGHDSSGEMAQPTRIRARFGFDYSGIVSHGSINDTSSTLGFVTRTDITNIGGTHWNLNGYWRGRLTKQSRTDEETLQNVLNKTYTMQLTYDNPDSRWVAGVGRLYLPWANSLDTIDGGYFGSRVAKGVTLGLFAGSTPDPTSWHYNPDRRIGGTFVNFEGGSGDSLRYTSTAGIALNTVKWKLDRPFLFFENGISYKTWFSVYHSFIADAPSGLTTDGITPGPGISRSYLTFHTQPLKRLSVDFYHNYFRDVPTASTALIGTGLVDKLLYQGVSVGVRVEPIRHIFLYTTLGKSDKTGDTRHTLNQMYGFTWGEIGRTGLRADLHYSKFDSSFGTGNYEVLTLSRHLGDRMMWDAQIGRQSLISAFTTNNSSNFVDTSFDINLWKKSFVQSGFTTVRGAQANYNQWYMSLGYRFDTSPDKKKSLP